MNGTDFNDNDAVIKLWLPERLLAAIDVLCAEHDASRPDVLFAGIFSRPIGVGATLSTWNTAPRTGHRRFKHQLAGGISSAAKAATVPGPGIGTRRTLPGP
jgi:hypothetical protein